MRVGYLLGVAANERKSREDLTSNLRVSVNNAYGFLKGNESLTSFRSVTFEEMVQRQLDRLTGKNAAGRSETERLKKMRDDLVGTVTTIKNIPQDQFYSEAENNAEAVNPKQKTV